MFYGYEEMSALGMSSGGRVPRIHAAQAAGCAPIATAFAEGKPTPVPCTPNTLAKSLAIGNPSDGSAALEVIRRSGGSAHGVTDAEIREGIDLLAVTEGVFTAGGRHGNSDSTKARRDKADQRRAPGSDRDLGDRPENPGDQLRHA